MSGAENPVLRCDARFKTDIKKLKGTFIYLYVSVLIITI
jgi:hypothetical protein